ncbi:hypothetical protein AMTR_s00111p00127690 [Amborella trichopoda]|uniref:DNA-directed RNA polymerase I subunit RPA12 n=1 Tax=Amborella trichopoda TaxID=13333 RepID=W1NY17_AMBTC|nr:hypothetical protein AMTR_s00111p00127690 [Amborella trichopoda]
MRREKTRVKPNHDVSELAGREICYTITAEDLRRDLNLEPFVQLDKDTREEDKGVQRTVVNEPCPKCLNPQLEYHTKQLRSADEGQTVFYDCPKCRHKFSVNT